MTKLVFHLGDMKTGSTAIQSALSAKRWTCNSVKLIFPNSQRVSHIGFAQSMLSTADGPKVQRLAEEILSEIRAHPEADVAVISAEHFENVDPKVLKQAITSHMPEYLAEARFISYVRPHAERIPSTYAERVKTGMFVGTLTELHTMMHKRNAYIYTPRFLSWRETFGSAFELRPMIRDRLYRKDVVADFLQFVLQTDDFTLSDTPDANESVSLENLSILRQLHVKLNGGKHRGETYQATMGRALSRRMNEGPLREGTKVRLHRSLAQEFCTEFGPDAAALDAAFFTGTPMTDALMSAPAKAVEVEQSVRIEDNFTPREQNLINLFLDQTCVLMKADPDFLAEALRIEHRVMVLAPEDEAPTPPKRRRMAKAPAAAPEPEASEAAPPRTRAKAGKMAAGRARAGKAALGKTAKATGGRAGGGKGKGGRRGGGRAAKTAAPSAEE